MKPPSTGLRGLAEACTGLAAPEPDGGRAASGRHFKGGAEVTRGGDRTRAARLVGLRPYQVEQVEAVAAGLADGGVGQLHAACGSGKTLTAQCAAERLLSAGGTVAVLAPSLALVAQTLASWRRHAAMPIGATLAICGDDTVTDAPVHLSDVPAPVTTDPQAVAEWLRTPAPGLRLIVGTYRSAERLAEAVRGTAGLDLLIVDEAHHLAGRPDSATRKIVDPAWLPAVRRLYMTATPRTDERLNPDAEGTPRYLSMDDTDVFGPVLHRYPFARAIAEGYLEDYRIAVVGIADSTARALLTDTSTEYVDRIGGPSLQAVVAQAALVRARELYGVRRAVAFHPTVAQAAEFARTLSGTVKRLLGPERHAEGLYAGHVHGEMDHHRRAVILDRLRTPEQDGWTVIGNVRCLGEGVDVPAVDAVLFAHPKSSAVDIVQAVGRALRRHPDTPGPSTIIVPIVVPDMAEEVGDLDAREYDTLWQVVRALRAHDEPLGLALDIQRSHHTTYNSQLPDKITVVLPDGTAQSILEQLTVLLVRQTTSSWWEGYARAAAWHAEHGHLDIPLRHAAKDGFRLGQWLVKQRQFRGRGWLAADRIAALDKLGIVWDPSEARWQETRRQAAAFHGEHGHLDIPHTRAGGQHDPLGQWIVRQRQHRRAGNLSDERIAALDAIGMIWEHRDAAWQRNLDALAAYRAKHGDTLVPQRHVTPQGLRLGAWLSKMRAKHTNGALPAQRIADLEAAGIVWRQENPRTARYLTAARAYHAEHGHLNVPFTAVYQGLRLGQWVSRKRAEHAEGNLTAQQIQELNDLQIRWEKPPPPKPDASLLSKRQEARSDKAFHRGLLAARAYHAEHGHLRPAQGTTIDGLRLDAWLYRQRTRLRQGKLAPEQARALDELGIRWGTRE